MRTLSTERVREKRPVGSRPCPSNSLRVSGPAEPPGPSAKIRPEACAAERLATRVVGVPVSLDCNFPFVQQTIGFDTFCRTLRSPVSTCVYACASSRACVWTFMILRTDMFVRHACLRAYTRV